MKITKRQLKRIIREEFSRLKRRGLIRESALDDDDKYEIYDMLKPMFGSMIDDSIESVEYDEMGGSILVTGYLPFVDREMDFGMGETYPVFENPSEYNAQAWAQGLLDDLYIGGHAQVAGFWYGGRSLPNDPEGKGRDGTGNGTVNVVITLPSDVLK